jgi:arabinofuranosyltransferase
VKHAAAVTLAILIIGALYVLAAGRAAGEAGLPLDDSWIHARLARNLADGRGFAFNPGQPSAASSAPLWTLLLSMPTAAGLPFPWGAYLVGLVATAALAAGGHRLAGRITGDRGAALLCALLLIGTHPFPWVSLSGMEASLAAALVLWILLAACADRNRTSLGLAAAAGCVRPELVLLPAIVLADALYRTRPFPKTRALATTLGAALATVAPLALNRVLTGLWLPGSFQAKVGRHGLLAALLEGRTDVVPGIVVSNPSLYLVPLLTALLRDNGALLLLAPLGIRRFFAGGPRTHLPWIIALLLPCAVAIVAPFGGPGFHEQRYIAPIVATIVVSGCIGLFTLSGPLTGRGLRRAAIGVVVALSAWGSWSGMERYAREVKDITDMQMRIGRWLRDRPGGPGTIATNDIGAIGYVTSAPILDLTGLASPEVIPYLRRTAPDAAAGRGWNGASEAGLLDFLRARRPDYVVIFPSWYPSRFFQERLGEVIYRVDLEDNLICGDRTMIVFRPDWGATVRGAGATSGGRYGGSLPIDRQGCGGQAAYAGSDPGISRVEEMGADEGRGGLVATLHPEQGIAEEAVRQVERRRDLDRRAEVGRGLPRILPPERQRSEAHPRPQ